LAAALAAPVGRDSLLQRGVPQPAATGRAVKDAAASPRTLAGALLLAVSAGSIAAVARVGSLLTSDEPLTVAAAVIAMVIVASLPSRLLRVALTGGAVLTRGAALCVTLLGVWLASAIVGGALYGAYRWLRPSYLALRYERYAAAAAAGPASVSGAVAEVEARRAWLLDPFVQALDGGLWLALAGTLVALLLVYGRPRRRRE
jgi:hypothetical protein